MSQGGRSTALKPLGWALAIQIVGLIGASRAGLDSRIIYMLAIFTGLTLILYLAAYIFFMFTDRDALRSETYVIQKLAIEKRLVGDSTTGLIKADELPPITIPIQSRPQLDDKDKTGDV